MWFARNYERKIDKMAENAIFSVYAVPIFVYQKQTYDDNYVDFSRLFQKIHKFSCVPVYIWIRIVDFSFKLARVETREDPNTTISRLSSARQGPAIYMAFRWRADDGPTLKAVLVAL